MFRRYEVRSVNSNRVLVAETLKRGLRKCASALVPWAAALRPGLRGRARLGWADVTAAAGSLAVIGTASVAASAALKRFADSAILANKEFVGFSAGMSLVFAQRDLQEAFRKMRVGGATAKSAQGAVEEEQRLKSALEPMEIRWNNLKNNVSKHIYGTFADAVDFIESPFDRSCQHWFEPARSAAGPGAEWQTLPDSARVCPGRTGAAGEPGQAGCRCNRNDFQGIAGIDEGSN